MPVLLWCDKHIILHNASSLSELGGMRVPSGSAPHIEMKFKSPLRVGVIRQLDADSRRLCLIVFPLLLLFGALAKDVVERESMRFDTPFLLWLHAYQSPFFDHLMLFFTWIGGARSLVLGALYAALLGWYGKRGTGAFLVLDLVGVSVLNVVAKTV